MLIINEEERGKREEKRESTQQEKRKEARKEVTNMTEVMSKRWMLSEVTTKEGLVCMRRSM